MSNFRQGAPSHGYQGILRPSTKAGSVRCLRSGQCRQCTSHQAQRQHAKARARCAGLTRPEDSEDEKPARETILQRCLFFLRSIRYCLSPRASARARQAAGCSSPCVCSMLHCRRSTLSSGQAKNWWNLSISLHVGGQKHAGYIT